MVTPHAVYQNPRTPFVANFIGTMNFLAAKVVAPHQIQCGNITLDVVRTLEPSDREVKIAIRPEDVRLLGEGDRADEQSFSRPNVIRAVVEAMEFLGSSYSEKYYTASPKLSLS